MERKKIGLFMSEITQFFQERCGKALAKAAAERDMDLIIYASYGSYSCPYGRNLLSEIGKKNIIHLPDYSRLDGIIVLPNTFDILGMDTEFFELVRKHAKCPVVCLQNDYSDRYPDFYSITFENLKTMYSMTKHFIDVHGFTDLCYMSGPFVSKDSPDRLRGFKRAMEEAGLEVRPNMVYEGNYWLNRGAQAMEFFMEGRDTYPQAVICANDYMALSICDELKKRGLRVPEDVCVSGFDGIREGQQNDPPLTSVTIKPERYADAAIRILEDIYEGKQPEHRILLSEEIDPLGSCGCSSGAKHQNCDSNSAIEFRIDRDFLLREAGRIVADYQNRHEIENSLTVANYYFRGLGCSKGYLCFCDDTVSARVSVEQNRAFSDEMTLMQIMRSTARMHAEVVNQRFRRTDILPPEYFETEGPETYIIFPLHYKSKEYGYLVINPAMGEWPNALTDTYTSELSAALENNYYQNQFSEFADIKRLSETDPLTGLYNRRGFENGLTDILSIREKETVMDGQISIVSIDMDNLKTINDVYGHSEGDYALTTLADTLQSCIMDGEICARFGGDEFSAILITEEPDRARAFEDTFAAKLLKASESSGKPYPIHASIGTCGLKGRDTKDIFACMQAADEKMYINKRNYKNLA